jgi:hypothetical protein
MVFSFKKPYEANLYSVLEVHKPLKKELSRLISDREG